MGFMELAKARFSVRKFADKPVEQEKLDLLLEAGNIAPTAKNQQPQRIYVIRSKEAGGIHSLHLRRRHRPALCLQHDRAVL